MASHNGQRSNRTTSSPTTKGPMKATVNFGFQGNVSPHCSKRKNSGTRSMDEFVEHAADQETDAYKKHSALTPDLFNPAVIEFRAEKPKSARSGSSATLPSSSSSGSSMSPSSLSKQSAMYLSNPYLNGEWPKGDFSAFANANNANGGVNKNLKAERGTQKPKVRGGVMKLAKEGGGGRLFNGSSGHRMNPSLIAASAGFSVLPNFPITTAPIAKTTAIDIPTRPGAAGSSLKNSLEGESQEIQKLWDNSESDSKMCCDDDGRPISMDDGRRAPIVELLSCRFSKRFFLNSSSSPDSGASPSGNESSGPDSPNTTTTANNCPTTSSGGDSHHLATVERNELLLAMDDPARTAIQAPHPKPLVREPPDGSDKVKTIDSEWICDATNDESSLLQIKMEQGCCIPSTQSAFCPLLKSYVFPSLTAASALPQPKRTSVSPSGKGSPVSGRLAVTRSHIDHSQH